MDVKHNAYRGMVTGAFQDVMNYKSKHGCYDASNNNSNNGLHISIKFSSNGESNTNQHINVNINI